MIITKGYVSYFSIYMTFQKRKSYKKWRPDQSLLGVGGRPGCDCKETSQGSFFVNYIQRSFSLSEFYHSLVFWIFKKYISYMMRDMCEREIEVVFMKVLNNQK